MMGVELRALRLEHSCEKHVSVHTSEAGGGGNSSTPTLPDACIGLDTWAPNLNLNRDPRWGRNWEVASEDPYLTGRVGEAYSLGFQNGPEDPEHLLGVLTIKHWAGYQVENNRMGYNDVVHSFDLSDSYLPAFRNSVLKGHAAGVMCSYNAINGVPTCASEKLTQQLLRKTWGFDGYVTSDSGAINGIGPGGHQYTKGLNAQVNGTALAINAGCDINSGHVYVDNVGKGLLNSTSTFYNASAVDAALGRAFRVRMRLGLFDPAENQPFSHYGPDVVGSAAHHMLSYQASQQGITLFTNR